MKWMIFSLITLGLLGMNPALAKDYKLKSHFDPQTVQWSKSSGNAAVAGIGIYRIDDGLMKSCAGQTVFYYPYSDYVLEQLRARSQGISSFKNLDPRSAAYRFSVPCDQNGDFHITHLPAGSWIFAMNIPVVKNRSGYSSYGLASASSSVAGEGNGVLFRIVTLSEHAVTQVSLVQGDINPH